MFQAVDQMQLRADGPFGSRRARLSTVWMILLVEPETSAQIVHFLRTFGMHENPDPWKSLAE